MRTFFALTLALATTPLATGRAPVPKMPVAEFEVHAVGVYEGTLLGGAERGLPMHPTGNVTVKVNRPATRPVVLVLTSYEPVEWKIEAPKGAVVRVITSGYYNQQVVGLDKDVPVAASSFVGNDKEYFYAYKQAEPLGARDDERKETQKNYEKLERIVKERTKREIKSFQGAYTGASFEIK
jgi:hypothetical protein